MKPLAIDLFCGLGGWTEGLLSEGWRVIGFDIERHIYGDQQYPAQLVLQDVRTIHGKQFRDADLIVAASPCQEFSYRAMPWKRAKALGPPELGMELFAQAARIQKEACEAAGRYIPMIQENVRGAQKYVGRAQWHYGSYYLWGDVPALMPFTHKAHKRNPDGSSHGTGSWFAVADSKNRGARALPDHVKAGDRCKDRETGKWTTGWNVQNVRDMKADDARKNEGGSWFNVAHNTTSGHGQNPDGRELRGPKGGKVRHDPRYPHLDPHSPDYGIKQAGISGERSNGKGDRWFQDGAASHGSKSSARKAASARIAKIPFPLASHIARVYLPGGG